MNFNDLDQETRKIFILGMKLCFAMKDIGMNLELAQDFIKGTWESIDLNGPELSETINQLMLEDLMKLRTRINEEEND